MKEKLIRKFTRLRKQEIIIKYGQNRVYIQSWRQVIYIYNKNNSKSKCKHGFVQF